MADWRLIKMAIVKRDVFDVTRSLIQSQRQQITAIENMFDEICNIKDDVDTKFTLMGGMVKRIEDSVYIYYEEQKQLQSIVGKNANSVAQAHYSQEGIPWGCREDLGAEIRELAGYAIRKQWKALKDYFEVTRYPSIRRVDFERALQFLRDFPMGGTFIAEFERWKKQRLRKMEREAKWNV